MPNDPNVRYIFLTKKRAVVDRIRKSGGRIDYVSRHSGLISARIPAREANQLLKQSDVLLSEKDGALSLPKPKVRRILTREEYEEAVRAARQTLTWNIRRVWDGRPPVTAGRGIRVGVIDTGIDLNHPDLRRNIRGGVNFVNPGRLPQDGNGHGTHVAGILAARSNRVGVVGVAPSAGLYTIKVLDNKGTGTLTDLIRGIDWGIDHRMHILNLSLAIGFDTPASLVRAVNAAVNRGILVICAAGNSGNTRGTGDNIESPGRIPAAVAVAATNRSNRRASFSSTGSALDLSAPGVNIPSAYIDDRYAILSGTSMAAPHVSGVAAVFRQRGLTPSQTLRRLYQRAIPLGPVRLYGKGLVRIRPLKSG
ncbi:subtilisin/minor extracellular protease Epr [Melghirimyces profundicolus]|uniref:Subtilisin/minor extracellular protease Epr n=1 Tax=Melghirimyces profundicolus TaxID=1242148 RepID=A0A2T6BQE0_9BACL|nr:S8 family peptidase [Melghirimyces profundicolus]PTX58305.1 subtilisin/minor extracellular protease Epr [Melghirimyces profundicolus]